jgi:predicted RNA methylase
VRALNGPIDQTHQFVLFATKGLIDVAEAELRDIVPDVVIGSRADRFLIAGLTAAQVERVGERARLLDDIRLLVAGPTKVPGADGLTALCTAAEHAIGASVPGSDGPEPWSVTVSARNPPWRNKPRWDPKPILAGTLHGADPHSAVRQPVDVRLQIDGKDGHAAVNLWDRPVGKKDRDITTVWPGALRPTVAAALVRIAVDLGGRHTVYDPFCGSGTILGEAARLGLPVYASDHSPDAVRLTRDRLTRAGLPAGELTQRVFVRDARTVPDPRVDARLLVTNPPWGKQVGAHDRSGLFDALARQVAHTLRAGGAAVLLTTHEEQLIARLQRHGLGVHSRRIGLLGQTPAILTCTWDGPAVTAGSR